MRRIVFHDLSGPTVGQRNFTKSDDAWLQAIATQCDIEALTIQLGNKTRARRAEPVEPVLTRELDGNWCAGRFIGEIRRGDRVLEIRPRLGLPTIAKWASSALNLRLLANAASRSDMGYLLAELQAATWKRLMHAALRHSLPTTRARVHHQGRTVHGCLDVHRTVALRAQGAHALASTHTPKTLDNPASRVILLAAACSTVRSFERTGREMTSPRCFRISEVALDRGLLCRLDAQSLESVTHQ